VKDRISATEVVTAPRLCLPPGTDFRVEWIDFKRGIRIGNLEPHERITRILKAALETGFGETFVTARWGRGVYWQWIALFPQANRLAKPISSHVNFGCAKFFISLEREDSSRFKAGMQVERGYLRPPREYPECKLRDDWDWHRLLDQLKPKRELERLLTRLVHHDGFRLFAGSWAKAREFSDRDFKGAAQLRRILTAAPANDWCGFQLFYPFSEQEVHSMSGGELIESVLAIFSEVTPVMNCCLQIELA
jgi:hypothetical protein